MYVWIAVIISTPTQPAVAASLATLAILELSAFLTPSIVVCPDNDVASTVPEFVVLTSLPSESVSTYEP